MVRLNNPEVVDKITGERSLNLCLGGEEGSG